MEPPVSSDFLRNSQTFPLHLPNTSCSVILAWTHGWLDRSGQTGSGVREWNERWAKQVVRARRAATRGVRGNPFLKGFDGLALTSQREILPSSVRAGSMIADRGSVVKGFMSYGERDRMFLASGSTNHPSMHQPGGGNLRARPTGRSSQPPVFSCLLEAPGLSRFSSPSAPWGLFFNLTAGAGRRPWKTVSSAAGSARSGGQSFSPAGPAFFQTTGALATRTAGRGQGGPGPVLAGVHHRGTEDTERGFDETIQFGRVGLSGGKGGERPAAGCDAARSRSGSPYRRADHPPGRGGRDAGPAHAAGVWLCDRATAGDEKPRRTRRARREPRMKAE